MRNDREELQPYYRLKQLLALAASATMVAGAVHIEGREDKPAQSETGVQEQEQAQPAEQLPKLINASEVIRGDIRLKEGTSPGRDVSFKNDALPLDCKQSYRPNPATHRPNFNDVRLPPNLLDPQLLEGSFRNPEPKTLFIGEESRAPQGGEIWMDNGIALQWRPRSNDYALFNWEARIREDQGIFEYLPYTRYVDAVADPLAAVTMQDLHHGIVVTKGLITVTINLEPPMPSGQGASIYIAARCAA